MPAMLEDPTAPTIHRTSGLLPYPDPNDRSLPATIEPRQVILRDRTTVATLLPFATAAAVPPGLLACLAEQLNREIGKGDTYPMQQALSVDRFGAYWFQNFGAIVVLGEVEAVEEMWEWERDGVSWAKVCLGSFYVKPNYPGRSSHVCNGGFLVTDASRNKGVGRLMGEVYLEWAPRLGYTYSVFNLVYETNVASCRIWDALGFKRIGRVKGAGNLRSHDELVDAIIYGRDLGPEGEDFVSEERFDKIRFYLKHGKYPSGADRAEKSRLRSAATHYKLLAPAADAGPAAEERLMLKDKEVVADAQRQYEIARRVHARTHAGINKTTATITEHYHWVRIKETVNLVIKNCVACKDAGKIVPSIAAATATATATATTTAAMSALSGAMGSEAGTMSATALKKTSTASQDPNRDIERLVSFDDSTHVSARRGGGGGGGGGGAGGGYNSRAPQESLSSIVDSQSPPPPPPSSHQMPVHHVSQTQHHSTTASASQPESQSSPSMHSSLPPSFLQQQPQHHHTPQGRVSLAFPNPSASSPAVTSNLQPLAGMLSNAEANALAQHHHHHQHQQQHQHQHPHQHPHLHQHPHQHPHQHQHQHQHAHDAYDVMPLDEPALHDDLHDDLDAGMDAAQIDPQIMGRGLGLGYGLQEGAFDLGLDEGFEGGGD